MITRNLLGLTVTSATKTDGRRPKKIAWKIMDLYTREKLHKICARMECKKGV